MQFDWHVLYRHPSQKQRRKFGDKSTGNLVRHVNGCEPSKNVQSDAMRKYLSGSTYTPELLRFKLAMWCTRKQCPFVIVEDDDLKDIFVMFDSRVQIPSAQTVSSDIKNIHKLSKGRLKDFLKVNLSVLVLALFAEQ